jgi:hypothetical protein
MAPVDCHGVACPQPPKKGTKNREPQRFTPDDIVRAIEGVEKAGLQILGVEITPTGAIKIATGPRSETGTAATNNNADTQGETKSIKGRPRSKWKKQTRRVRCFDHYHCLICRRHGRSVPTVIRPSWTPLRATS